MIRGSELRLLNGFELTTDGVPVSFGCAAQRLVAYLALQRRPRSRMLAAATLWPEASEERARANLRSTLWRLRAPCARIVAADGVRLTLSTSVVVDVDELVIHASALIAGNADLEAACLLGLDGELLPDWYDDWVLIERERLRQLRLHALESVARRRAAQGRYGEACDLAVAALAVDPLRETAHQLLIELHLAEGNRVEAVRHYALYRRLLAEKFGLEPTPQMRKLIESVATASFVPLVAART